MQTIAEQRFVCYVCQVGVPLSMLVLNDRCRHSICRVCFLKVDFAKEEHGYQCVFCTEMPTMLATLSPGTAAITTAADDEESSSDDDYGSRHRHRKEKLHRRAVVGFRVHFMENDCVKKKQKKKANITTSSAAAADDNGEYGGERDNNDGGKITNRRATTATATATRGTRKASYRDRES